MVTSTLPAHRLASASMPKTHLATHLAAQMHRCFWWFSFSVFCCAFHRTGNAIFNNAAPRKYRPCRAFPTLFEAAVKEHIVQNLALSLHPVLPLHVPVKIKNLAAQKHTVFCVLLLRISSKRDAMFNKANIRKNRPCHAVRTLLEDKLSKQR